MNTDSYTLEELAEAAGMTVRNVRSYQTRGLIPPPRRKGRRSVYGREHLARLSAIKEARQRGASLKLIETHLSEGGALEAEAVRRTLAPGAPTGRTRSTAASARVPERLTSLDRLLDGGRLPATLQPHLDDLIGEGVLRQNGRRIVTTRELASALVDLHRHGLPLESSLQVAARTALAARTLADDVSGALQQVERRHGVHSDLVRLVVGVLTTVILARSAP